MKQTRTKNLPVPPYIMSLIEDETLHMFFDPNFDPVEFVDALYLSAKSSGDLYSAANVKKASTITQELITRLDCNTTEIVMELVTKLEQLRKLAGLVKVTDIADGSRPLLETTESKRLEYYADVLRHSVETLSEEVKKAQDKTKPSYSSEALEKLANLKRAEDNLLATGSLLLNVRKSIGNLGKGSISLEKFQEQLNALQETITSRLREGSVEDRHGLALTVREMKTWIPLFQPLTYFYPVFTKFIRSLENELS